MIGLQNLFPPHQYADWLTQLKKELKEDGMDRLSQLDPVEGITITANAHKENSPTIESIPGVMPYYRGSTQRSNQWKNIHVENCADFEVANTNILKALMNGADGIRFDLRKHDTLDLEVLTKDIQFEYIQSQWVIVSLEQWFSILEFFNNKLPKEAIILYDHFEQKNDKLLTDLISYFSENQQPFLHVNGFAFHECGSNASNEIGFCLAVGNEYLEILVNSGMSIDQATACLFFSVGIGSNYFVEISKIRALRWGWSSIVSAYSPKHACSHIMQLNGEIGWLNKSLKDPNTNYLRQTAEAMSAIIGGVNGLVINPFDSISENGRSSKSIRMAQTIPLMLQDESFLNQVIDPLGGSYTIEIITNEVGKAGWETFKKIHSLNGPSAEGVEILKSHLKWVTDLRVQRYINKLNQFIGMNCYPNPAEEKNTFNLRLSYLSFEFLQLENHTVNA